MPLRFLRETAYIARPFPFLRLNALWLCRLGGCFSRRPRTASDCFELPDILLFACFHPVTYPTVVYVYGGLLKKKRTHVSHMYPTCVWSYDPPSQINIHPVSEYLAVIVSLFNVFLYRTKRQDKFLYV